MSAISPSFLAPLMSEAWLDRIDFREGDDVPPGSSSIPAKSDRGSLWDLSGSFWRGTSLAELAIYQRVSPIVDIASLSGDFWPEDESVDEFIEAIGRWRDEAGGEVGPP